MCLVPTARSTGPCPCPCKPPGVTRPHQGVPASTFCDEYRGGAYDALLFKASMYLAHGHAAHAPLSALISHMFEPCLKRDDDIDKGLQPLQR